MCPTLARFEAAGWPCPLVSLTRSWVRILSRARERAGETRRVAAPSRLVPKNSGRRGGAFSISPAERGFSGANLASLALARARKTEADSGRKECRSEGNLNYVIVSSSGGILKLKSRVLVEFIPILFNGLLGAHGLD